jgi:hypothetical protein
MSRVLAIVAALTLSACAALQNGGGLMGHKATTGGSFTIIEGGKRTVVPAGEST